MGKKFLSLLGTGNYTPCVYEFKNKHYTKYIQEVLVKEICNTWDENDEVIIFLTKEARKNNWYNEENEKRRLKEILRKSCNNINIVDVDIPSGRNEDEIWNIFEIILEHINYEDKIVFDITHSFRSIPMLVLVVLNYAKAVKNIKLANIYYGAYEARYEKDEQEVAPVFDLTSFDSLLEWSEAVNLFLKYGNGEKIKELSSKELIGRIKKDDEEAKEIRRFIERLNDFTNNIFTCRGKVIVGEKSSCRKSIATSYEMLQEKIDNISQQENTAIKPLKPLISKIADRISDFSSDDNLKTGMAVVKWSIDNNLIQQGYTALDETIKTYLCKKHKLDDSDYDSREEIISKALNITMRTIEKNNWSVKDEYLSLVEKIVNEVDYELSDLCNRIKVKRNDINHFGFNKSPADYNSMKIELNKCYCAFKYYIEKNSCDCKE